MADPISKSHATLRLSKTRITIEMNHFTNCVCQFSGMTEQIHLLYSPHGLSHQRLSTSISEHHKVWYDLYKGHVHHMYCMVCVCAEHTLVLSKRWHSWDQQIEHYRKPCRPAVHTGHDDGSFTAAVYVPPHLNLVHPHIEHTQISPPHNILHDKVK